MEKTIHISKQDILVSLRHATVIHTDKYTETSGGWGNLPVTSTLYTDVVFRSHAGKEDWHLKIKYYDLPIYNDQEVMVISANNIIIGYIDMQTKKYYYTSSNLCGQLGLGMSYWIVWAIGLGGGLIIGLLAWGKGNLLPCLIPLIITWLVYRIQKWMLHLYLTKAVDQYLQDK